jgi:hypothetical protein
MQSANDSFSSDPYFFPLIDDAGFNLTLPAPQLLSESDLWFFLARDLLGALEVTVEQPSFDPSPPMQPNPSFFTDPSIFSLIEDAGPALPMPALYPSSNLFPLPMIPWLAEAVSPPTLKKQKQSPRKLFHVTTQSNVNETMSPTGSSATSTAPARKKRVQRRKRMNREEERIAFLKNDDNIESFTSSRATCSACWKRIKLDTRDGARFYVGAWVRHKTCCKEIKKRNSKLLVTPLREIFNEPSLEAGRLSINEERS